MFGSIGSFVYRMRYTVIAVLVALMGGLGLYGINLSQYLSQSGWFDPHSESAVGSVIADTALGRDHKSDVILLITPPEGTKVDDPAFGAKIENIVNNLVKQYPDIVSRDSSDGHAGLIDPFEPADAGAGQTAAEMKQSRMWTPDRKHAFISIGVAGDDDTTILNNYKTIEPFFDGLAERYDLPGTQFQLAGLQPIAAAMSKGMEDDISRAEVIALPVVALMLLFVFGGVVAAVLPVFIGGITIAGSLGIMKILAQITELNIFAQSVVTLIGLGIAIDYGLFIVSRFREELAEGYTVKAAVRRTVMTAGQTVVFSATIIVAALACLLMFPQAFLKSVAYGAIASVGLAAVLSITVLPAILAILGTRIDALSLPFLNRSKTREEVEEGFWGRLAGWVMQNPVKTAVPTVLLLLALIIPFGNIQFGGMTEAYLPPDNANRIAQEDFDKYFPTERTEDLKLIVTYDQNTEDAAGKIQRIADEANQIPGFTKQFSPTADGGALEGIYGDEETGLGVTQMSAGLVDRNTAPEAIKKLREIDDQGMTVYVAGTPTLTQDSIDSLIKLLPWMAILLVLVTGLLMFLAFGSVILPIKAALMTALGLGATLGILTWIFIDGHGSSIANFTPGPLFAPVLVLIIAIIYGLSTDYEIFLLSRMVEARQQGASTTEAIRTGTAHTGRIITAAAAILVVVTGAFGLSDIVMMKYIAYGMIAALILDATVIRMLLVPSIMKLLGDDCWWSPRWMQRLQQKIGLGEAILEDDPSQKRPDYFEAVAAGTSGGVVAAAEAPTTAMRVPERTAPRQVAGRAEPTGRRRTLSRQDAHRTGADSGPQPTADSTLDELVDDKTASAPAKRPDRRDSGPDTGSWKLGLGGVRQTSPDQRPRPQPQPQATVGRPGPSRGPVSPATSGSLPVVGRSPADGLAPAPGGPAPSTGRRPIGAPPVPPRRVPPRQVVPDQPAPQPPARPQRTAPAPRPVQPQAQTPAPAAQAPAPQPKPVPKPAPTPPARPAPQSAEPQADAESPAPARELRPDRGDSGNQISVQDLLRRSRSQQSDEE
ncbi:MMPL family transporter [Gordonia neofelifaecis]|uniref:Drug exporter of the RND superfamily-like protein n=1 Tax=Gordonia neofelifaecis NRRL B-59395 TaxID=644548 RepID=F1YKE0_9ACTN|nr:MMPL family transporter [Gordonia neofelifaecis]EGD54826.1 drug exporter of the RND superfamily-like protein [Gordonia neofelifaecis NRRL B-59395]